MEINKDDLVKKVSQITGVDRHMAKLSVDAFLKLVRQATVDGDTVKVHGFGEFGVKYRGERHGRDMVRKINLRIPGKWIPFFSPSPVWKDKVAEKKKDAPLKP